MSLAEFLTEAEVRELHGALVEFYHTEASELKDHAADLEKRFQEQCAGEVHVRCRCRCGRVSEKMIEEAHATHEATLSTLSALLHASTQAQPSRSLARLLAGGTIPKTVVSGCLKTLASNSHKRVKTLIVQCADKTRKDGEEAAVPSLPSVAQRREALLASLHLYLTAILPVATARAYWPPLPFHPLSATALLPATGAPEVLLREADTLDVRRLLGYLVDSFVQSPRSSFYEWAAHMLRAADGNDDEEEEERADWELISRADGPDRGRLLMVELAHSRAGAVARRTVGFILLGEGAQTFRKPHTTTVRLLEVFWPYRRRGLAAAAVRLLEECESRRGATALVCTPLHTEAALGFWAAAGFRPQVGRRCGRSHIKHLPLRRITRGAETVYDR